MNEQTDAAGRSVPEWAIDTLGLPLLGYLLNCNSVVTQAILDEEHELSEEQLKVVDELNARWTALSKDLDEAGVRNATRHWLLQVDGDGRSNAVRLRALVYQEVAPAPTPADEVETTFAALARAVYPAFLMPTDVTPIPAMPELEVLLEEADDRVPSLITSLPAGEAFVRAIVADKDIGRRFTGTHALMGAYVPIYLNTGHGGPVFLRGLSMLSLRVAWREVQHSNPSEADFVTAALTQLAIARRVLNRRTSKVRARFAFTGVLLPADAHVDLGRDGVVRPVTDADQRYAPSELRQQLGGAADDQGNRPYISYAGDIVLDFQFPYRAWIPRPADDVTTWLEKVPPPAEVDKAVLWLRMSLVLAVEREQRTHIVQTWQHINDPLASGIGPSWRDPRWGRGLVPVELTQIEVDAWGQWYRLLRRSNVERIELAMSRVMKAVAERREPADVLIDSVIAWENIFGTPEGEPTFRVTTCLAKLLRDSLAERRTLRTELGKIYKMRSDVVHGNRSLTDADFQRCDRALDVAIAAIRILVEKRPDLLAAGDGASRSTAVLLAD